MSLKFKYQRLPGEPIRKFNNRPYLTIMFISPDGDDYVNVFGLLDSGADSVLIPLEIAEYLSIPAKEKGERRKAFGISAQEENMYCMKDVRIKVVGETEEFVVEACFMENQPVALLGRTFFEQYKSIKFKEDKKEFELEKIAKKQKK